MSGLVKRKFFQSYSSGSNTYTIPKGITTLWIEVVGAGGGGGGSNASGGEASGGGGGGSYAYAVYNVSDLSSTLSCVVGTGGAGGTNSAQNVGVQGTDTWVALIGQSAAGQDSGSMLVHAYGGGGGGACSALTGANSGHVAAAGGRGEVRIWCW